MTNREYLKSLTDDEWVCRMSVLGRAKRVSDFFSCGECPIRRFCEENITVDKYCENIWVEWLESEHKEEEE